MDSKKSPLALLAQTCSQIGSDSPAVPSIGSKGAETKRKDPKASPVSGASSVDSAKEAKKESPSTTTDKRSATPEKRAKSSSPRQTAPPKEAPGLMNDPYRSLVSAGLGSPFPFPYPGLVPPGFGLPGGPSAYPGLDAYALAKAAMPPPGVMNSYLNPAYLAALQYGRKSDCRDPYCTGCPPSSVQMVCVAGCALSTQCDHPKVPIPSHLSSQPPTSPSSGAAVKPYVCNWIVADNYCGKRFATSDDLLQHLRTHTNAAAQQSDLSHHLLAQSFGPRAYPTPPLSPLSAARYHPYGKSPAPGSSQQPPQPFPMLHPLYQGAAPSPGANPAGLFPHPALAPYYSHLSLFGPRPLGSAPLPP